MIRNVRIRNFKSVYDDSFELGRVNVFIGENGSGKSNILEAFGYFGSIEDGLATNESIYNSGVRITKPTLTKSAFQKQDSNSLNSIQLSILPEKHSELIILEMTPQKPNNIHSPWELVGSKRDILKKHEVTIISKKLPKNITEEFLLASMLDSFVEINLSEFLIYAFETSSLRGIQTESRKEPLGIHGEGLDLLLHTFLNYEWEELLSFEYISWLKNIELDREDRLKFEGHKLGRSTSALYFRDKFMAKTNNIFSAENANEGALHVLGYLALMISEDTPGFFAIDNIENSLNPKLCRELMKQICRLAEKHDKQVLITTHNPAILDGLNLHDDEQRLFVVSRNDEGHTVTDRIKLKPNAKEGKFKLSELWMRGYLGGIPTNF